MQSRIHLDELLHLVGVTGHNHHEPVTVVFHALQERIDRLLAVIVLSALCEGVCLVDEQNAVQRGIDHGVCLDRRLPDVLCDKPGAVGLDELVGLEYAQRLEHLGDDPCHRRLARSGIAGEHDVV